MNILRQVIRRILVRNVDNAVSTIGRNLLVEITEYSPNLPSIKRLIFNLLSVTFINYLLINLFIVLDLVGLALLTPLFFISTIIRPIFRNRIYGRKQVGIEVTDRRYKTGTKTVGYKFTKDKDVIIEFTQTQKKISKVEGILKLLAFIALATIPYKKINSKEFKVKLLKTEEILSKFELGDTLIANQKYSSTNVFIKVKEKKKYSKGYDISFEEVYTDSSKYLGLFVKLDSITDGTINKKYISYIPFHKKEFDKKLIESQKRIDTLFYINCEDGTITESNLP